MQRKWSQIWAKLGFLALILEAILLVALYAHSYRAITRLDSGETPLYVDARGYLKLSEMFTDGSFLSTSESLNSIDRVRRPPGFPAIISLSSFILDREPAHALALVHFWAGLLVMLGLWYFVGKGITPGATLLALYLSGFFALQDPFRGAIPEWLLFLALLAFSICLICFFRKVSAGNSLLLISLMTFISLLKSVFTPFVGVVCLLIAFQKSLSPRARISSISFGVAPLLLWCGINYSVLGTPAPAVDLGYNLFGSTALLPWPELGSKSQKEETFRKLLVERRARAPEDIFESLNTRHPEVSVQDYNIWAVATPTCEELKLDYLECENWLRSVAFEVVRASPVNYIEYVIAQIRLDKNRWSLEVMLWFLVLAMVVTRLCFPNSYTLGISKAVQAYAVLALLTAAFHAVFAQLYLRYLFPCHRSLLIAGTLLLLSSLVEALRCMGSRRIESQFDNVRV
jgi:hypothetical protein